METSYKSVEHRERSDARRFRRTGGSQPILQINFTGIIDKSLNCFCRPVRLSVYRVPLMSEPIHPPFLVSNQQKQQQQRRFPVLGSSAAAVAAGAAKSLGGAVGPSGSVRGWRLGCPPRRSYSRSPVGCLLACFVFSLKIEAMLLVMMISPPAGRQAGRQAGRPLIQPGSRAARWLPREPSSQ